VLNGGRLRRVAAALLVHRADTIYGALNEIQTRIIAERVLGYPGSSLTLDVAPKEVADRTSESKVVIVAAAAGTGIGLRPRPSPPPEQRSQKGPTSVSRSSRTERSAKTP